MKSFKAYKFTSIGCTSFKGDLDYSSCTSYSCTGELRVFKNGLHFGSNIINALDVCPDEISEKTVRLFEVEVTGDYVPVETKIGFYGCTRSLKFIREISWKEMISQLSVEIEKLESVCFKDSNLWEFDMLYMFGKIFSKPLTYSYTDKNNAFYRGESLIVKAILEGKCKGLAWFKWWKTVWTSDYFTGIEKQRIGSMMNKEYLSTVTNIPDMEKILVKAEYVIAPKATINRPYKISAKGDKRPVKRTMKKRKKKLPR